ncbi:hypothetical protein L873DRAFT_250906 [Choiromyces venosus 120613-1]|uniref:Uncharacterized protein n=1 Tax=Choiromyces venosus 120613-1 TaxID=1336337 RepID=A0A3N4J6E4_9PEZI|nr:hypothetical protein L873DRAFT_250906 [Choiromyces venosus 120613-1]
MALPILKISSALTYTSCNVCFMNKTLPIQGMYTFRRIEYLLHGNDRIATTIQNEKCQDSHYKRSQEKGGKTLLQLNNN